MAVAADGELTGSIGGGLMEVNLVEQSRATMSELPAVMGDLSYKLLEQVHQKNSPISSGMICSGKQTVIMRKLTALDITIANSIIDALESKKTASLTIASDAFSIKLNKVGTPNTVFNKRSETDFIYTEKLGPKNELFIVGGGHCSLALSELMSRLDFRISIFDDRPDLNTIEKNRFAHEIKIIESYEQVGEFIPSGPDSYVVVMTLGFNSDETVIRSLFDKEFKYFGVLGSKAKMKTLLRDLENDGVSKTRLASIHTPIGLQINSHTPEEIAISIAAEIISIKNS
jgi:xanthine dehydrogenase accessory factor